MAVARGDSVQEVSVCVCVRYMVMVGVGDAVFAFAFAFDVMDAVAIQRGACANNGAKNGAKERNIMSRSVVGEETNRFKSVLVRSAQSLMRKSVWTTKAEHQWQ